MEECTCFGTKTDNHCPIHGKLDLVKCETCIWQGHFKRCEHPDGICEYTKVCLPEGYTDKL